MNRNEIERLKQISPKEFAYWGLQDMAYIRRVTVNDQPAYAIHAADGTPMGVMPRLDVAQVAVRQHDLEPLSVH
ncbi:MAG: DUF1150 family protein [Stellaceae bacterium]